MADNPVVKYTENEYRAKISRLEACVKRLQSHLERLEDLRSQVRNFWDDPQTPHYLEQLTKAIVRVRNSMDRTQALIDEYNALIVEMGGVTTMTSGLIDDIGSIVAAMGTTTK